ncbi:MAG: hypothetical protein IPI93_04780 [Sphingobacteriaceae bacterium]|nr:hypothetical protein [Sphingobacteriaceae bacterium]MBK7819288.1 hypothetical protein [Sphingobacteriaceae bacterium]
MKNNNIFVDLNTKLVLSSNSLKYLLTKNKKMETTSSQKPILVKMADQLVKNQQDLDALAVQLSLGKAEAKDKFEEIKKDMRSSVQEFKASLEAEYSRNKEWANAMKPKLNYLEGQLAEGETETNLIFEEKKKNILKGLVEITDEIEKNPEVKRIAHYYNLASDKFQLQLDLVGKTWNQKKLELTNEFHDEMKNAKTKLNEFKTKINEKKDEVDLKLDHFKDEMQESYGHLKKAFKSL